MPGGSIWQQGRALRRRERLGPGWRRIREQVLSEEPTCRVCGEPSTVVDHIVPLYRSGRTERSNLQGLCKRCHDAKTSEEIWEPRHRFAEMRRPPAGVDLVMVPEIARRLGVQHDTARRWTNRDDFPSIAVIPGKEPLRWWPWSDVEAWARTTGRLK